MATAQERLDWLLETEFVPTNATITVAEIVDAVGDSAARLVTGTLQAGAAQDPLLSASWQAISTVGMSLSGADRQGMIDQLAAGGGWPDAVRDAVKQLGGKIQPRWKREGYETEPTLERIEKEFVIAAAFEATATASGRLAQINGYLQTIDPDDFETVEDLQAYVDALLASDDGKPPGGE